MNSLYNSKIIEEKWQKIFDQNLFFSPDQTKNDAFVIIMPPPNVTGILHNGHALFLTLQDILIRFNRLKGKTVLWVPGTDHAGIATQIVVERELLKTEGKTRQEIGREKFLEKTWNWVEKNGQTIIKQMKRLGASADWSRQKFTMDHSHTRAVNTAFVQLWNENLIYRSERIVNWDSKTKTVLSNEEIEYIESQGELFKFAYKILDLNSINPESSKEEIVVATTRPETMLGDTAIAVSPNDPRYKHLNGKKVWHPFLNRIIPIVFDSEVDPNFGTGAVKITPAHDPIDFSIGERHNLERISIFTPDLKINSNGGIYCGLTKLEARDRIKKELFKIGLARGSENISHNVGISSRSGEVIEPILSKQYFVKMSEMAHRAFEVVNLGQTRIIPSNWKKIYDHFMLNIQDWCISRQLWWGHRIPIFYDLEKLNGRSIQNISDGEIKHISIAAVENLTSKYGSEKYQQEEDVLDTWFSSAIWPLSVMGWPDKTKDLEFFYPSSVLETGSDILFFWVARMMMFGIHFTKQPPFKDIYLHGMVRDSQGRKMSKSLGNSIDPLDVIDGISLNDLITKTKKHPVPRKLLPKVIKELETSYPDGIPALGSDGLRLSLAMLSGSGGNHNIKLSIPRMFGYRAFLNKIWNASLFVLRHVENKQIEDVCKIFSKLEIEDKYILSQAQHLIENVNISLSEYNFSRAAEQIYHFVWVEMCDWYIELAKLRIQKQEVLATLSELISITIRLLHPFCPFITEEIWENLPKCVGYCSFSEFPKSNSNLIDSNAENEFKKFQDIVIMFRNARQESKLPVNKKMSAVLLSESVENMKFVKQWENAIIKFAALNSLCFALRKNYIIEKLSIINSNTNYDVILLSDEYLDLNSEQERLNRELNKIIKNYTVIAARLNNPKFVECAPENIVEQHKEMLIDLKKQKERIGDSIIRLRQKKNRITYDDNMAPRDGFEPPTR